LSTHELVEISLFNHNTKIFKFKSDSPLNIPPGHHITIVQNINGSLLKREYTPISQKRGNFEILVKKYDTAKMSQYIHSLKLKDKISLIGPMGTWKYTPQYSKIIMIAAGTGITPMYQILNAITTNPDDKTIVGLLYANKDLKDILLKKN